MSIKEVEMERELIPYNEYQRLDALKNYEILDSSSEETFRQLAETAALALNTSVAIISFIDADRVYLKEYHGGKLAGQSVKRTHSLCSLAILQDRATIFKDLILEPCCAINSDFINTLGIQFYAGIPLKSIDGYNIGVLAVADNKSRDFTIREERILQNLAKMVEYEMELRSFSLTELEKLNKRINNQHNELTFTQAELDKSQKETDNFLYRASHDLKGPLATMAGLLNLAHQEITDGSALCYVEKLSVVSANMNEALNKLCVIYSLLRENENSSQQTVSLDNKAVKKIIDTIVLSLKREINQKNIQINVDIENIQLQSNRQYLELILSNCIENAVHFHKVIPGRKPKIDIEVKSRREFITIKVRDNGEGLPDEYQDRIFELFFRGKNSARSGMGLYIVKKLVEKSKGAIRFLSDYGQFTEFVITLPIK
jgi:signal transduction histidine kinase